MVNTADIIRSRYNLLSKTIDGLEKRIKTMPEGRIHIRHHNNAFYYYHGTSLGEKYIQGNELLIEQLVQKNYLQRTLLLAKREQFALGLALNRYPESTMEDAYEHLPESRKQYAKPIVPGDDQYVQKWLSTPYKHKPFKKDSPEFYTLKGERVRSKSEVIIADRLYTKGIPYKYEYPVQVGKETLHPDFKILKMTTRKDVYLEHCGMMDDADYVEDMLTRSKKLDSVGIRQGKNLFYTFETSKTPLDLKQLDTLIEDNFR